MNQAFLNLSTARRLAALAALTLGSAASHAAGNLIVNGDFETGSYAGWNANVEAGSSGNLSIVANGNGTSPNSGSAYLANPNGGNFFSITDQTGPGSYSLTQSFTLASAGIVHISFDMFANDEANVVFANGRDFVGVENQNAEVDILTGSADAFTNAAADIVSVLYGPGADSFNNPNPWTSYASDLSLAAGTYQIRFAETDNLSFFQQGVDNVSITTASSVPEPGSLALMIAGLAGIGAFARRAQKRGA